MNLQNLLDTIYTIMGYPDTSSSRSDFRFQQCRDLLNTIQNEISATMSPSLYSLIRETTLTVTAGTTDYLINDWCQHPLSMLESVYGNRINLRRMLSADCDGSRNPNLQGSNTLNMAVEIPRTTDAAYSGAAGSTTGATAAEDATTVTFGASIALGTDVVGRMLKLNGENNDYKILTRPTAVTVTIDKPIVSRVRSTGTSNIGAGYAAASCKWEIGPKGRFKIRFLPSVGNSPTIRYMAYPRKLVGLTDEPELQEDMHDLLWQGAVMKLGASKQNETMYQMYANEYKNAIELLKKSDEDEVASEDGPRVERLNDWIPVGIARGTDNHRRLGF